MRLTMQLKAFVGIVGVVILAMAQPAYSTEAGVSGRSSSTAYTVDPGRVSRILIAPGTDQIRVVASDDLGELGSTEADQESTAFDYLFVTPRTSTLTVEVFLEDPVLEQPDYRLRIDSVDGDVAAFGLASTNVEDAPAQAHSDRARYWEESGENELALRDWFLAGSSHFYAGEYPKVVEIFEHAAGLARELRAPSVEAWALSWVGVAQRYQGASDLALDTFCRALLVLEWSQDSQCPIGAVHYTRIGLRAGLSNLNEIGLTHHLREQLDLAAAGYQRVLEIAHSAYPWEYQIAVTNNNLGGLYLQRNQYVMARNYFEQGMIVHERRGELEAQLNSLSNMARASEKMGDLDGALYLYGRAMAIGEKIERSSAEGSMLLNLGLLNSRIGRWERAEQVAHLALQLLEADGGVAGIRQARYLLGDVALETGNLTDARNNYLAGLKTAQQEADNGDILRGEAQLAKVALADGDTRSALELAGLALARAERLGLTESVPQLLLLNARVLAEKGDAEAAAKLFVQSREHPGATDAEYVEASLGHVLLIVNKPEQALGLLEKAESRLKNWRDSVSDPFVDAELSRFAAMLDEYRVHVAWNLFEESGDQATAAIALMDSDYSQGRTLATLRGNSTVRADRAAEISDEISRLMTPPADLKSSKVARIQALQLEMELVAGDRIQPVRLERLTTLPQLEPGEALIAFQLSDIRSYAWLYHDGKLLWFALPAREEIDRLVKMLIADYRSRKPIRMSTSALSDLLFAGIPDGFAAEVLYVLPDESLHFVPFVGLNHPGDPTRTVIDELTVINLPSLRWLDERTSRQEITKALVLGDPTYLSRDQSIGGSLQQLPGTAREIDAIQAQLGAERVDILRQGGATREAFVERIAHDYSVIHVASHGIVDIRFPELSGIMLSSVDSEGQRMPGFVSAREIATRELTVDLVVLSACETGLGRIVAGEGPLSLSWSFLAAGADQVVATLWRVPDRSTRDLMIEFYRQLDKNEKDTASALRAAQMMLRSLPGRRHPYHWAAFTLTGI